ncbi:hypothetical protein A1O1_08195 [Capronia coronata CBS 617.96]|uniref:tRNA-splicing endonuclease subunit Sen15 domain-containing protein n=1 Tax=Capronia coronata CBS 617.96 TaxID=1182541 RepID=W9XYR7_9EURO|nr:uncharacterized protein A1O1_08195 [Capronia coronata CBS 617.96]EXJ82126.1 hypothetical protein A1O1_08195 [Capronia coronata CBS 617.96]
MSVTNSSPPSPSAVSTFISHSGAKSASEALALEIMHNLQHQHNWTDLKRHLVHLKALCTSGSTVLDRPVRSASPSGTGTGNASPSPSSSGISTPSTATASPGAGVVTIISGLPPQHSYIHPDLQAQLLKYGLSDTALPVQREFVLPLALGEKWSLARFCAVFDQLPERDLITVYATTTTGSGPGAPETGGRRQGIANGQAASGKRSLYEHRDQRRVLLGMRAREGGGGDGTVVYYIMQEGEVKPRQNG